MNKLKYSAEYLTPQEPIANNCNTNRKLGGVAISNTYSGGAHVSATRVNQGRGSTGVEFHQYNNDKFNTLSKEQRDDITEWRNYRNNGSKFKKYDQENSNNKINTNNKEMKKMISAAVGSDLSQLLEVKMNMMQMRRIILPNHIKPMLMRR